MSEYGAPHFLLVGHVGSHSRGCEAIVRSTVDILRNEFPDALFTVASWYPEEDGPLTEIPGLRIIPGLKRPLPMSSVTGRSRVLMVRLAKYLIPYGMMMVVRRLRDRQQKMLLQDGQGADKRFPTVYFLRDAMLASDIVLSIGGDIYSEFYGTPTYFMELIEFAQSLGRNTVIWGASIGPFPTPSVLRRMVALLRRTDLITVRDDWTAEYLRSLSVQNNWERVADPAFIMEAKSSKRTVLPFRSGPIVGLNGSGLMHLYLSTRQCKQIIHDLGSFARVLIDDKGCNIVLVPHDLTPGSYENDWVFLYELAMAIGRGEKVYLLPPGLDARETKFCISQCGFFVGMRMHSIVASLSQHVPTIALSYSPKYAGLMQYVYGHTDYLISYNNLSFRLLIDKFQQLQANADDIRRQLAERIPELQTQARLGGKYVRDLLTSNSIGVRS